MTDRTKSASESALRLEDRRAFMLLPLDERRHRLAEQADRMVQFYESNAETAERLRWQEGDVVEY